MKYKSSRGFTLIELLAVIVILAVLIMIAMPYALRMMTQAQKNAFVLEANSIVKIAQQAYAQDVISGVKNKCYKLSDLHDLGYSEKDFTKAGYTGSISFVQAATAGNYTTTITIWLANGSYRINGVVSSKVAETGYEPEASGATAQSCP